MRRGRSQTVYSKWIKHSALLRNKRIGAYLPETVPLTNRTLLDMLKKHTCVYVKPVQGSLGYGVFRIKRVLGHYEMRYKKKRILLEDSDALCHKVEKFVQGKKYLVQQGIAMIGIQERPIDFRILVQRPQRNWIFMGIMGRWATPRQVITNLSSGGKPIRLRKALTRALGYNLRQVRVMERRLIKISLMIAHTLQRKFHGLREIGVDVAINQSSHPWILEVNTRPGFNLFRYHADKTIYPKIVRNVRIIR